MDNSKKLQRKRRLHYLARQALLLERAEKRIILAYMFCFPVSDQVNLGRRTVSFNCRPIIVNLGNMTGEERRRETLCDKRDNNFV